MTTRIGGSNPCFAPTLWTIVRRAARPGGPEGRAALEVLIERYWKPVYSHVRRRGHSREDAKDLTQAFFLRLLEGSGVAGADPERGRFRSYLLGALDHFLSDAADAANAIKRGGGRPVLSLDVEAAEGELRFEPAVPAEAEAAFARDWALEVLGQAMERLAGALEAEGRGAWFEVLRLSLAPDRPAYATIAASLGIRETDVTNWLHRARKRYRQEILAVLADSTSTLEEAREELRELFGTVSR